MKENKRIKLGIIYFLSSPDIVIKSWTQHNDVQEIPPIYVDERLIQKGMKIPTGSSTLTIELYQKPHDSTKPKKSTRAAEGTKKPDSGIVDPPPKRFG